MMTLSTKFTVMFFSFAGGMLGILYTIIYMVQRTITVEASNILSSILVFLLVWERLRESLSKKLEYLDDSVFLSLHSKLQDDINQVWTQDEIRKVRDDLKRHAKFMNIPLFPYKLSKKLDEFLSLHEAFYGKFQQLLGMGEIRLGKPVDRWTLLHYLGFETHFLQPSPEEEKAYKEIAETIKKEPHSPVYDAKTLFDKAKTKRKQIFQELEEFLKCNNLRLKP